MMVTGEARKGGQRGKGAAGTPSVAMRELRPSWGAAHCLASWEFGPVVGKGHARRSRGSVNSCIWVQEEEGHQDRRG